MKNKSFTLIELLLVIALIGLLASIIFIGFKGTIERAKITRGLVFSQSIQHSLGAEALGLWTFNEGAGGIAYDLSGNGNDGLISGASWTSETPHKAAGIGSNSGYALNFTASLQRVTAGPAIAHTNLTLEAWIYPTSYPSERATIILGSGAYYLSLANDGSLQCYWYGTSPEGYHSSGANVVPLNTWSHVVATWNGSKVRLYVNSDLKNTVDVTGAGSDATSVIIGAEGAGRQFIGIIDEARIYSQALTQSEIQKHYVEGLKTHNSTLTKR